MGERPCPAVDDPVAPKNTRPPLVIGDTVIEFEAARKADVRLINAPGIVSAENTGNPHKAAQKPA